MIGIRSIHQHLATLDHLQGALALLEWDANCYMPAGAAESRAEQIATVRSLFHEKLIDPKFVDTLRELEARTDLTADETVVVQDIAKEVHRALRLPDSLVRALATTESLAHSVWVRAKKEQNFATVKPILGEIVGLRQDYARCLEPSQPIYDVLLDLFEPGSSEAVLDRLFGSIRPFLFQFAATLRSRSTTDDSYPWAGSFPVTEQKVLLNKLGVILGFDFNRGRLDVSPHPFSTGMDLSDIRITTRYSEVDVLHAMHSYVHEVGHALYSQGHDPRYPHTALAQGCSTAVHESQSLFFERHVFLTPAGTRLAFRELAAAFPENMKGRSAEQLYRYVSRPRASVVRLESDEVHYALHILLRYEIERDLFAGRLDVDSVELAWNQKTEEYFGTKPRNSAEGVLQDVHWYSGGFGYFSTYLLGAIYAAQIAKAISEAIPQFDSQIEAGELRPTLNWLREKVHMVGKRLQPQALIESATSRPLSTEHYQRYLQKKYGI